MRFSTVCAGLAFAAIISGCATTYDPAEVCTAQWIKPRAERAVKTVEKDTQTLIRTFRKSSESFNDGRMPGAFQMMRLTNAVNKFVDRLENGRGMKDLRILSETCNDPEIITDAMAGFMRSQGLSDGIIRFIEDLDMYQEILERPSASAQSSAS